MCSPPPPEPQPHQFNTSGKIITFFPHQAKFRIHFRKVSLCFYCNTDSLWEEPNTHKRTETLWGGPNRQEKTWETHHLRLLTMGASISD